MIQLRFDSGKPQTMTNVLVETKIDGGRHEWDGKSIISERGIIRNARFPHIVAELRQLPFVGRGEVAIPFGNIHMLNASENWSRARFYAFDVWGWQGQDTKDANAADNRHLLEVMAQTCGFGKSFQSLRIPFKFPDFQTGWAHVLKHKLEGLVMKELTGSRQFKVKHLTEIKVPIVGFEPGAAKGAFRILMDSGVVGKCSALSVAYVQKYKDMLSKGLPPYAEIEYLFLTDKGIPFQPCLRQLGTLQELQTT